MRNKYGHSYLAADQPAPLLCVCVEGKFISPSPDTAAWDAETKRLTLQYGPVAKVVLQIEANYGAAPAILEAIRQGEAARMAYGAPGKLERWFRW